MANSQRQIINSSEAPISRSAPPYFLNYYAQKNHRSELEDEHDRRRNGEFSHRFPDWESKRGVASVEIAIAPPFTAIAKLSELLGGSQKIRLGAQNFYFEKSGAYTGEISATMLRELFVKYVIIGQQRAPRHFR